MGSPGFAVLVDIGLILLFGLQHSVMARPGFKRVWTRVVPKEMERSLYVLISSVVLALFMWQWRPIPTPVLWHADAAWSVVLGWSVMGLGVAVLLWATFLINHFELFGLQQGWITLRGGELRGPAFVTPYLYKIVRHPLYVGWLLIFWGAPTMTAGHFLFSAGMSGYILLAIRFEERDLVQHIGEPYRTIPAAGAGARAAARPALQWLDGSSWASTMRRNSIVAGHGLGANALELGIAAQPRPDRIQVERGVRTVAAVHAALHEAQRVLRTAAIRPAWARSRRRFQDPHFAASAVTNSATGASSAAPLAPSRQGCMSRRVGSSAACRATCRAASRSSSRS